MHSMERQSGYSLAELMIGLALLVVITLTLGTIFVQANNFLIFASQRDELVERSRRLFDELEFELMTARVVRVGSDASGLPQVEYMIPIDVGEDSNGNRVLDAGEDANGNGLLDPMDGDVLSPDQTIQWGCIEADGARLDQVGAQHRVTLSFSSEQILEESALGTDLNNDGDQTDRFHAGSIELRTTGGLTRTFGGGYLLLGVDDPQADRDGDGVADPLFTVTGESYVDSNNDGTWSAGEVFIDENNNGIWDGLWNIHCTFFSTDSNNTDHALQLRRSIASRNPQE